MTEAIPEEVEEYAQKGTIIALVLIGIYVALRFYWSVVGFIDVWAPREFADLLEAFFNLAVLLVVAAALVRTVKGAKSNETEEDREEAEKTEAP